MSYPERKGATPHEKGCRFAVWAPSADAVYPEGVGVNAVEIMPPPVPGALSSTATAPSTTANSATSAGPWSRPRLQNKGQRRRRR